MKTMRPISILLSFVLLAGVEAAFARDGGHHGGAFASRHSGRTGGGLMSARPGAAARPVTGVTPGYQGVRSAGRHGWQGVRPNNSVHPQPGVAVRHRHPHRSRFIFGGTVILGAPFFYPTPVYVAPVPVYTEPPVYIEQGSQVYYYYCPDYRDYYPNVATCPSPWLQVLPEAVSPD